MNSYIIRHKDLWKTHSVYAFSFGEACRSLGYDPMDCVLIEVR
jgi:hypothetical protein